MVLCANSGHPRARDAPFRDVRVSRRRCCHWSGYNADGPPRRINLRRRCAVCRNDQAGGSSFGLVPRCLIKRPRLGVERKRVN